jgi:glycosyltransferase involved in cell wall biosynthesis
MPLPVAFLIDVLNVGGAESQLISLLQALDPARIRPHLAVLREGSLLEGLPIPVRRIGMRGPTDISVVPKVRRWLLECGAGALYTTHPWSALLAAVLAPGLNAAPMHTRGVFVASEHSYRSAPATPVLERFRRAAVARADRVIAVSRAQAEWLAGYIPCKPERIEVIPNGIDPAAFENLPERRAARAELALPLDEPLVVCVARLSPEKGHAVLFAAMERVNAHLLVVGEGPERSRLERLSHQPALAGRVHFAGTVLDLRVSLAAADLFALASSEESQGIALVEAMAAGLPVVASRVGGIPEVVDEGVTGTLFVPGDSEELARVLGRALRDEPWRVAAGERGREVVRRRFSIAERAKRIEELLLRLVQEAV